MSPTTHTVSTRAAAAAPVGGGEGLGREELPFPPERVRRRGAPPPPHRCTPSPTTASLARAHALKAFLPSDVRVIRAAVARSRWDPRRAAA